MAWNVKNEMPTGSTISSTGGLRAEAERVGGVGDAVDEEPVVLEEPEHAEVDDHGRPHEVDRRGGAARRRGRARGRWPRRTPS